MEKTRSVDKDIRARIEYIPRTNAAAQKTKSIAGQEQIFPTTNMTSTVTVDRLPLISLKPAPINASTERSSDEFHKKSKINRVPSINMVSPISPSIEKLNTPEAKKISYNDRFWNWYNQLTPKQKFLLKVIGIISIITAILILIILPVYFTVIRQSSESSFTNITVSVCSNSTCIGQETPYRTTIITVLYPFDGNYNDLTGYATGTPYGSPIFSTNYPGYLSQAVYLPAGSQQYIQIPYVNLSQRSFTVQTWVYPTVISAGNDLGIFSQCDSNSICLSLSIRSGRLALSFDAMNVSSNVLIGTTVLSTNNWFHVTLMYDLNRLQQQIYVNGEIDAISSGIVSPFRATSTGSVTIIGKTSSASYGASYYFGRIDLFTISAGSTRTTCQIYNDATLVVYYPFDSNGTWNDYSVNLCNGIASGTTAVSIGRVGQAVSFTSSTSYFQALCYPRLRSYEQSFSFSLWINPTSNIPSGTIIHLSTMANGSGTCYDLLAFTSSGALVCQWMQPGPNVNSTMGPSIPSNTWTHIAVVYNNVNGIRLFVNGQFATSSLNTGTLSLQDLNPVAYITLANVGSIGPPVPASCLAGSIPISSGSFIGMMDEFRLYNRELDSQEICVLAGL
ncbi:unnamed protein product [Adineta ricciae]|uniref:LamG-like jellyroll fold domain-containing protein n=1 Tax=Adineta ricciae TaxID=249248 RepID=A0A814SG43_ADIRI|nr:unnamed protein product [Adineta ricciae]